MRFLDTQRQIESDPRWKAFRLGSRESASC
jgi:hypothetical protein